MGFVLGIGRAILQFNAALVALLTASQLGFRRRNRRIILAALAQGPRTLLVLCEDLGMSYDDAVIALNTLKRKGAINIEGVGEADPLIRLMTPPLTSP